MASIFDVATYILKKQGSMTTMKLQKLCYYAQAWSLVWDEEPIFDEDFQAWANGPICPSLFAAHRGLFFVSDTAFTDRIKAGALNRSQQNTINNVLKFYGDKEPLWLSNLTHQEAPWLSARKGYDIGESCSETITKESMQQYYAGL